MKIRRPNNGVVLIGDPRRVAKRTPLTLGWLNMQTVKKTVVVKWVGLTLVAAGRDRSPLRSEWPTGSTVGQATR
jgi:hypothetical protein